MRRDRFVPLDPCRARVRVDPALRTARFRGLLTLLAAIPLSLATAACSGRSFTSSSSGGAGGSDASSCDMSGDPASEPCLIADQYGVFVSASGDPGSADGSQARPFPTIAQALPVAEAAGKNVYVCADGDAYHEALNIGPALDGLHLYGGFHCNDWTYDASLQAHVISAHPVAATVSHLTQGLVLQDFELDASDATKSGASSFAMQVIDSKNVQLKHVKLVAGKGADGKPGTNGADGADGAFAGPAQDGQDIKCIGAPLFNGAGMWSAASACGSLGGQGGVAARGGLGTHGTAGAPTTNVTPAGIDNSGAGETVLGVTASPGTQGSNGNPGKLPGAAPAAGTFTAFGFTPADGPDGNDGFPGQGGGGGGASATTGVATCVGASGGAGGMGGCGGQHGTGGGGGGASVALFSWSSSVTLDACTLVAKNGGNGQNGGNAGAGGNGKGGGFGGNGSSGSPTIGSGGDGGKGGHGGAGSSGSGGSGGPSYALVFHATAPTQQGAVTLTAGQGGSAGKGGTLHGVAGSHPAPDGSAGQAGQTFQAP